jgi:unsaturated chondroitin disaccharide hydrolase
MTWIDEAWQRISASASRLVAAGSFPVWSDGPSWITVPYDQRERGVLPHDGSWMVGDVAAIAWFAAWRDGSAAVSQQDALAVSRRLANRTTLTSFASVSHMFFRGTLVPQVIGQQPELAELATQAARTVARRFTEIGYMKSFGEPADERYLFTTIDDVINLVLPLRYAKQTGDIELETRLVEAAITIGHHLVRPDGSAAQVLLMSRDGMPTGVDTYQGHSTHGCWSRGQAWGIYGYAMMHRLTRNRIFLDLADAMTSYWIKQVQDDPSPIWDFELRGRDGVVRDSFAASLAYAGILELADQSSEPRRVELAEYCRTMVERLTQRYVLDVPADLGILSGAALDVPHSHGIGSKVIVGDSYFTEAIWRLTQLSETGHSPTVLPS